MGIRTFHWLPCVVGAAFAQSAPAHVTLETRQAAADSYYKAVLQVPHGCRESPTVRIRVRIPDGVTSVKPQPKQGWKVETTRTRLAKPLDAGHGRTITETVSEVSWSGGLLADEHFDEFKIMMKLPDRPGATLYFPVVQDCKEGVHRWIEIPEKGKTAGELKEPAPAVTLTPKP
jgi:periplasmic copper chaperone A